MKYKVQQKLKQAAEKRYIKIRAYAKEHPELSQEEIGKKFGVSQMTVSKALKDKKALEDMVNGRVPIP